MPLLLLSLTACAKPGLDVEKNPELAKTVINACTTQVYAAHAKPGPDPMAHVSAIQTELEACLAGKGYDFAKTLDLSTRVSDAANYKYGFALIMAFREARKLGLDPRSLQGTVYTPEELRAVVSLVKAEMRAGNWVQTSPGMRIELRLSGELTAAKDAYGMSLIQTELATQRELTYTGAYYFDGDRMTLFIEGVSADGQTQPLDRDLLYRVSQPDGRSIDLSFIPEEGIRPFDGLTELHLTLQGS